MLNSPGHDVRHPPGCAAEATGPGLRYPPLVASQSPIPAAMRTDEVPGSQAAWGTRTSIWRRTMSTVTLGAGVSVAPVVASASTAVVPWTVRNSRAGETTPAPKGHDFGADEAPSAIA